MAQSEGSELKPVTLRLSPTTVDKLKEIAETKGLKYQPMIRMILREWLKAQEDEP